MKKTIALILSVLLTMCCSFALAEQSCQPGTYVGEDQGFGGTVSVTLTIDETGLAAVSVAGDCETPTIGGAALETLEAQLLEAKSADIDGVSGATLTSNGVKAAAANAFAAAAGKETASPAPLMAGTYTSTQTGYQGTVTVEVTVDEASIIAVTVTDITDHPETLVAVPCEQIPADIIANQSYNVDAVTGATFTSNAIKAAVRDCLEQAGGSAAFSASVPKANRVSGADESVDVLVLGGGGSGLMAALAAYTGNLDDTQSGLSVMLAEKQAFLGGSTGLSGGMYFRYLDETGAYDEAWLEQAFREESALLQAFNTLPIDADLLRHELSIAGDTNIKLPALGLGLTDFPEIGMVYFSGHDDEHDHDHWYGWNMTTFFNHYLPNTGIDVRMNTKATKLLTDESGAVIGAVLEDKGSTYNVYAKKVILATGGFPHNPDLIAQYAPEFTGVVPFAIGGATGDGFIMATEIGAATVGDSMLGYLGSDGVQGMWDDFSDLFHYGNASTLNVNTEGNRYNDESISNNVEFYNVLQQPGDMAWGIVDSDNADVAALANSASQHVYKAETLAELAELIGIPADALQATVEKYNADFDNGEDSKFGTPIENMDRVDTAPYYAYLIRPIALSSLVSLSVTSDCEVLNTEGSVIPNLYAAGDMLFGGNYLRYYVGGRGVGTAIYSGRLAGECAKAAILGNE